MAELKENNHPVIDRELLVKWNACDDGLEGFCELFPSGTTLEEAINGLIDNDHDEWAKWLFDKCKENNLYNEIIAKGYRNSGYRNSGHCNSGDGNSGTWNSGSRNSGHCNSGHCNSGHCNSGYHNSGYHNSGNWNSGHCNSGFFNSKTPDKILVFNKICDKKTWENAYKPDFLFFSLTYWVNESEMTDEEKANDPGFYARGGQLRERGYKEAFKLSWDKADHNDRIRVKDLPNFDAEVFYEISGIDLREKWND